MAGNAKPVRFGIVGLGYGAGRLPLIEETEGAKLVAVSSRSEEKARAVGDQFKVPWHTDHHELIRRADVDVVGIYTPSGAHRDIAIAAARAGKHVVVTKPLEITLERVDAIIDACDRAGVRLATEFVVRYQPSSYALYRAVHDGKLGKMILGEFTEKLYRPQWYYESDGGWRGKWAVNGGGTIVNQGIHTIDQMLWLFGAVDSVTAHAGTFAADIETEDTAVAVVKFKSGALGTIVGTTTFRNDKPAGRYGGGTMRRIEVNGNLGSARMDESTITMMSIEGNPELPREIAPPARSVFEDVCRWIHDDSYSSPTLVKGPESRAAMQVVLAIYDSARTGKTVRL